MNGHHQHVLQTPVRRQSSGSSNSHGVNNERHPLIVDQTKQQKTRARDTLNDGDFFGDTESEDERQEACRGMTIIAILLFTILMGIRHLTAWPQKGFPTPPSRPPSPSSHNKPTNDVSNAPKTSSSNSDNKSHSSCPEGVAFCQPNNNHHVATDRTGFPSFWNYATDGPMNITYDGRSFMINGDRVMFLSGSVHPIRTTQQTWEHAMDEAVTQGLNMITIYVFWAEHQPLPNAEMDWTLPAGKGPDCDLEQAPSYCGWTLADAIRSAANRGLFVHARIGPYVCAEYNYGGIPEWVALHHPEMQMRRLNQEWLQAMETFVKSTVEYFKDNQLFAYQGGPIVMAQIENELGEEKGYDDLPIVNDQIPNRRLLQEGGDSDDLPPTTTRKVTVQDYADWCGTLVDRIAPEVIWTMCNGLSANNTIITCNGDCSTKWLEDHGSSGRIQVDQPAIWSEGTYMKSNQLC
jgi:hypothetical protein